MEVLASSARNPSVLEGRFGSLPGPQPGDELVLLGRVDGNLSGTLYERATKRSVSAPSPNHSKLSIGKSSPVEIVLSALLSAGLLSGARQVQQGGLAVACAEMVLESDLKLHADLDNMAALTFESENRDDPVLEFLFSEPADAYCLTTSQADAVYKIAEELNCSFTFIGWGQFLPKDHHDDDHVVWDGDDLILEDDLHLSGIYVSRSELREAHEAWLCAQ